MLTFWFCISVWVFAQTCFLKEALSEIHNLGFFPHQAFNVLGPHRLMGTNDEGPSMKQPFGFGQTFITAKWNSWQRVPTLIVGLRFNWNVTVSNEQWNSWQRVPTLIVGLRFRWNVTVSNGIPGNMCRHSFLGYVRSGFVGGVCDIIFCRDG